MNLNKHTWSQLANIIIQTELSQFQVLTKKRGISSFLTGSSQLINQEQRKNLPIFYQQQRFLNPRQKKQKGFNPKGVVNSQEVQDAYRRKQPKFDHAIVSPGLIQDPYRPRQTKMTDVGYDAWKEMYKRWVRSYVTYYSLGMCQRHIKDFDRQTFKLEALHMYEKIHNIMATGNLQALHALVTPEVYENMSAEVNYRRRGGWQYVDWGFFEEPVAKKDVVIRSSAIVGTDQYNMLQNWVQIVLEIKTKQRFAVYDEDKKLISGDPLEQLSIVDYWVFERHFKVNPQHYWRLAGRLDMEKLPSVPPDQVQDMSPLNIQRKNQSGMVLV